MLYERVNLPVLQDFVLYINLPLLRLSGGYFFQFSSWKISGKWERRRRLVAMPASAS